MHELDLHVVSILIKLGMAIKKIKELDQTIRWWNNKTNNNMYISYVLITITFSGGDVDGLH